MFLFRARRYLGELGRLAPEMLASCEAALQAAKRDLDFTRLDAEAFGRCPSDSIDYAVMEKTKDAVVVPLDAGWSDVGSWSALHESLPPDAAGNVTRGDVITEDSSGCYLYSSRTPRRDRRAQGPRRGRDQGRGAGRPQGPRAGRQEPGRPSQGSSAASEPALHREVFRPWGSYDSVDSGTRFQVKRLTVKPGATLSLQMHHHRAEHWIVVSGTARITCDEKVFLLSENESTYIPIGVKHRIENPGKVPLHIIEVQSGSYLGEDDIVRFEDRYGREGTNT